MAQIATTRAVDRIDPHQKAFLATGGPEVFHSVCHRHDIWKKDMFDVSTIHHEAREVFEALVERATSPSSSTSGRILLLLGESGAGKTHLMRAFRSYVHENARGFCGYLQMTASTNNYGRYVLGNLIDSLDQPYNAPDVEASGLMCLCRDLVNKLPQSYAVVERFRDQEAELSDDELGMLTNRLADFLLANPQFAELDHNLLRALLYLERDDARIKRRVLCYLRCEDLSPYDRRVLGEIVPRTADDDPQRTVEQLGKLMWALRQVSLVLLVDQLEDIYNLDDAEQKFRRAISTICDLHDRVPSSIVLVSCLEDFYEKLKACLPAPQRFRLERDPDWMRLTAERSEEEIFALVAKRIGALYEELGQKPRDDDPVYPIPHDELKKQVGTKTRYVLDWCRKFHEDCVRAGELMIPKDGDEPAGEPDATDSDHVAIEQAWNDFRAGHRASVPETEEMLAATLARALVHCSPELEDGAWLETSPNGRFAQVELHATDNSVRKILLAICNKSAKGGSLAKQIEDLQHRADENEQVAVRCTEFPCDPKTKIAKLLGEFITEGGRRVTVEDSEWRTMLAFEAFRSQHGSNGSLQAWQRQEKPLSQLKSLCALLDLDNRPVTRREPTRRPVPQASNGTPLRPSRPATNQEPASSELLVAGTSLGREPMRVAIPRKDLTQHAAFLGGTGSGKTTLALNLLEQLLSAGVPVLLVDRKGDLCGYADEAWWTDNAGEPDVRRRKQELRSKVDVAVYTPGNPHGRNLAIRAVPAGIAEMADFDRAKVARYAAAALGGMIGYSTPATEKYLAILTQAIRLLGVSGNSAATVGDLIDLIVEADPELVAAIGHLNPKHFRRVTEDLQALLINRGELLCGTGEQLDVDALFGRGAHAVAGKTRLSILSTKFIGDNSDIEFWITQLLLEIGRWASRNPSNEPQAVVLFDEADMYLPATRKPATKGPMEDLLKRARSAGIGLFLATQSPGDLDYKCRDNIRSWFIGRLRERTAVEKLRPGFTHPPADLEARLAGQATGEFYFLCEGKSLHFRANRSLLDTRQLPEDEILALARTGQLNTA